jgi:hypothetical protein
VGIKITKDDHQAHWKNPKDKEETLFSKSDLHFGQYILGSLLEYINHLHTLKSTLLLRHGLVVERWAQGLLIMLPKKLGAHSSPSFKLFYSWGQISMGPTSRSTEFGCCRTPIRYKMMPEEIYSKQNRMVDNRDPQ